MSLSDNLALLRARRQLTQRQLAAKSGVGIATVNRIEGGDYVPNLLTLDKLARGLAVPMEELATPDELREARRAKKAAA
jgi:transcriptional regulator with XRE-family HTH domain